MASAVALKKNYRCLRSLQQFYSGGPYDVSKDGSFIVCACNDSIKIVDSSNAEVKSTIEGDSEAVTALTLSPSDNFLFSASHSRQIRVWDFSTLKCLRSWKGHEGPVMDMACHASGGLLATGGADRKLLVWDVDGGFCTHYFKGHKGVVTCVMFHPDHNKLVLFSASDDATVRVWDLTSKKCIATLQKHMSTITSLAVSEDGSTLLTAGRDKIVYLWNLHDYTCMTNVTTYEAVESVCVIASDSPFASWLDLSKSRSNDSSAIHFITVGERGIVKMWSSDGAVCLFEQQISDVTICSDEEDLRSGFISALMLPSSQGLLCVTSDQQFLFYSPAEKPDLNLMLRKRLIGFNEEILDLKFLDEEEQFLAVATSAEQVRVYDLASMSCSYVLAGHSDIIMSLDTFVSDTGKTFIVTGSKDNSVRLWESESRSCVGVGMGHMGSVGAVAFSKKRRNFFVSGSSDRTLKVWNLDSLSEKNVGEVMNLKAKATVAAHDKDINSLAIAPNDSLVCSGSQDRTASVRRLPDLVHVVNLRGHKRGIWSVEFSPVDQCVITASADKTVKIWAISDGSCLKTFEGHTSSVTKASFLTRGTQFVSCGADGLVKLWTVKTNECIATYDQHEDKIWALAIGKKTEMVATGGGDAVINFWHDSTASDKEDAFRKAEEGVLKCQDLENALLDADYIKAIQIAFELRRPHKLLEIFTDICRRGDCEYLIKKSIDHFGKEEFHQLLEYVRDWNTKPKFCHVAQFVLFQIFSILPPTDILEIKGIGELLEGLLPYTQRHFSRLDRLERSTYLLDYTLIGMSVIEPKENEQFDSKKVSLNPTQSPVEEDVPLENDAKQQEEEEGHEEEPKEETFSKKRKPHKSRDGKKVKKVKHVSNMNNSTISSQA